MAGAPAAAPAEQEALLEAAMRRMLPPAGQQVKLLAMLQFVDEALTRAGVAYWATGGTMLGAMRHRGFIPHDDDVDIELFASDLPRAIEALGAVGRSFRGLGEWPGSNVPVGRFFFWGGDGRFSESIDVFLREEPLEELQEFPSNEEVFPLRRVDFHNIGVMVPNRPEPFLARCYSPSWAEEAVVWGHSSHGRELLRASLDEYLSASRAAGYSPPAALPTGAQSLAAVGLDCRGELRELLWQSLGWASPYGPPECGEGTAASQEEDMSALDMLGLQTRHLSVVVGATSALQEGLVALRRRTSAFVELIALATGSQATLRVVGTGEELAQVEEALAEMELDKLFTSCPPGGLPEEREPGWVEAAA